MPDFKQAIRQRLARARFSPAREAEIVDELSQHLNDRYEELCAGGVSHDDARRDAIAQLDDLVLALADLGPQRDTVAPLGAPLGRRLLADAAQDFRFAVRMLAKNPGFAAVVVLTLALGIGANAAIFSVVEAVLLRPLPFKDPDRLVRIFHTYPNVPEGIEGLSPADFFALRETTQVFEDVAFYRAPADGYPYTDGQRPEQVYGAMVSADFLSVLGVQPLAGRGFEPGDDGPAAPYKVVVSYDFWQKRLRGDPAIVGRAIRLAGRMPIVVGVMPPGFWFPRGDRAELWVNERLAPPTRQGPWGYQTIGRLKPGVSAAQVQSDLDAIAGRVRTKFPLGTNLWTLVTRPIRQHLVGDLRQALYLLWGAVGVVLLIACVNIVNLMLARATAREREIAVRRALGASRGRIVRQLLAEALVLAAIGTALGLLVARWGVAALVAMTPDNLQVLRDARIAIDGRVVALAAAVAIGCACLFAIAPALAGSSSLSAVANASSRGTDTPGRRRMRAGLVVAEFALSVIVLAAAGLVTRSLLELEGVDPGVQVERSIAAMVSLPAIRYDQPEKIVSFYDRLLDAVRSLPGVNAASVSYGVPPDRLLENTNFIVEHEPPPNGEAEPIGQFLPVGDDYFRTLGIRLLGGRAFDARDTASAPQVTIVNAALVRRFFTGREAIGRTLRISGDRVATIVGVVSDVKYEGLAQTDGVTMYVPFRQAAPRSMSLIVRTVGEPLALTPALAAEVARLDPELPLGRTRTLEQMMRESVERPRFRTALLVLFALAALALAAIGIYGVMVYSVTQRTREMGIRMALGAQGADVVKLVVAEGSWLALAGVGLGVASALVLSRTISGLLFKVPPTDPVTFAGVAVILLGTALVACWLPARRATRADPLVALRSE